MVADAFIEGIVSWLPETDQGRQQVADLVSIVEALDDAPNAERARALTLLDSAVRDWTAQALRAQDLEPMYVDRVPRVEDPESVAMAEVAARNAQGLAELHAKHEARQTALSARLAAVDAAAEQWSASAHYSGSALLWAIASDPARRTELPKIAGDALDQLVLI